MSRHDEIERIAVICDRLILVLAVFCLGVPALWHFVASVGG